MWDRKAVKAGGRYVLGFSYWNILGVFLFLVAVVMVCLSVAMVPYMNFIITSAFRGTIDTEAYYRGYFSYYFMYLGLMGIVTTFLTDVLNVGQCRYLIRNHYRQARFGLCFDVWREKQYWNCVGALFTTKLIITLWSLLLIVPGIIKGLEYTFCGYLLADAPYLKGSRVREISRMLTDGQKGRIFAFAWSFFGWYLLGYLCLAIGLYFVMPYPMACTAELYIFLRDEAIRGGRLDPRELNFDPAAFQ